MPLDFPDFFAVIKVGDSLEINCEKSKLKLILNIRTQAD